MTYWKDKVCLVTGGSAGLGLALGEELAVRGAKVVLVARRQGPLDEAVAFVRKTGGEATAIAGDVAWQEDVDRIAATVRRDFGRLDFACNCAGRSMRGAVLDTTPEDFQQLLDVNFFATVRMTRALAPLLLAGGGHLVNVGSLASKVAAPFMGGYPVSKHAVAAYTQQLRLELGPKGLHVLLACPGPIARLDGGVRYVEQAPDVPSAAQEPGAGAKVKKIAASDVAEAILRACERRQSELVIPWKAKLLFALAGLSANWGDWLLGRSLRS